MNPASVGYYRVNYDAEMLILLLHAVTDGSLNTRDCVQLIDDAFAVVSYHMGVDFHGILGVYLSMNLYTQRLSNELYATLI